MRPVLPLLLGLALGLTLSWRPLRAAPAAGQVHGGGAFVDALSLSDAGWKNFVGQARGKVANRTGLTLAGQPRLRAAYLTIEPQDAQSWYAGLSSDLKPLPVGVSPDRIRLRGRVAAARPGPLLVRLESAPGHWLGFAFTAPADEEWLAFDWPLSEAVSQGRFDLAAEKLRLVVTYRDTAGPVWSSPGDNTLYVAEALVVIQP